MLSKPSWSLSINKPKAGLSGVMSWDKGRLHTVINHLISLKYSKWEVKEEASTDLSEEDEEALQRAAWLWTRPHNNFTVLPRFVSASFLQHIPNFIGIFWEDGDPIIVIIIETLYNHENVISPSSFGLFLWLLIWPFFLRLSSSNLSFVCVLINFVVTLPLSLLM